MYIKPVNGKTRGGIGERTPKSKKICAKNKNKKSTFSDCLVVYFAQTYPQKAVLFAKNPMQNGGVNWIYCRRKKLSEGLVSFA